MLPEGEAAELLSSVRAGGSEAARAEARLCARFLPVARLVALRHAGPRDADDVAQDALLVMLAAIRDGRVREPDRPGAFLIGVVRNLARTRARGAERARAAHARLASEEPSSTAREPAVDPRRLWSCFNLLGARAREVLVRTFVREEPGAEIAAALGIREDNVRAVRHRALAALHACLEPEGGER